MTGERWKPCLCQTPVPISRLRGVTSTGRRDGARSGRPNWQPARCVSCAPRKVGPRSRRSATMWTRRPRQLRPGFTPVRFRPCARRATTVRSSRSRIPGHCEGRTQAGGRLILTTTGTTGRGWVDRCGDRHADRPPSQILPLMQFFARAPGGPDGRYFDHRS